MSTVPHLHVVDANTGELVHDDRDILIEQLQAEKKGQSLQIGKLKRELRDLQAVEPEHETIREVLDYWRERCKPRATFAPASERWKKVRARLREKLEHREPLTSDELKLAVDGALTDRYHTQPGMPHRLDAKWIFRSCESVEELCDLALSFKGQAGIGLAELVPLADKLRVVNWRHLLTPCQGCDHMRVEHARPDPNFHGWERCFECDCLDFFEDPMAQWRAS